MSSNPDAPSFCLQEVQRDASFSNSVEPANEIFMAYLSTSSDAQASKRKWLKRTGQIIMMRLRLKQDFSRNEEGLMVEKLETRSAPALAAINAFVRGSSARLCSSNKLGWDGVCLEHHRAFPGERNDSVSPHHLVVLFTSHVSRGEASAEHARFVPTPSLQGTSNSFLKVRSAHARHLPTTQ